MGSTGERLLSPPRPGGPIRRLSSRNAQREDLFDCRPTLVGPDDTSRPNDSHETALALEMAKHHLAERAERGSEDSTPARSPPTTGQTTPELSLSPTTTDKYAFAFDIDGVLIRGGKVIPEAVEAMKVLNGQNEYGIKM